MENFKKFRCRFCDSYTVVALAEREGINGLSLHVQWEHPAEYNQIAQMLVDSKAKLKTFIDVVDVDGVWKTEDRSANVTLPVDTIRKEVII